MNLDFVSSLPANVGQQVARGLQYLKVKTPNDVVSTTTDVGSPQVTPNNSPIDGQVALTTGAPVEEFINIVIDTSEYDEDQVVVGYIGDASGIHEKSCSECANDENTVTPFIGSAFCNKYEVFINKLCSTPFTFGAVQCKVYKTSGATGEIELPERIEWSRKNLMGNGQIGTVELGIMEDLGAEERTSVRYVTVPLTSAANLFDRDTRWRIPGLLGKRKYIFTLYTGVRRGN